MQRVVIDMTTGETSVEDLEDGFGPIDDGGAVGVVLAAISDRQFFQALASDPYNLITETEAEDAVATGAIPAVMQTVVDALPNDQHFRVRMLLRGATTFELDNPLVSVFGASQGMDATAIGAFWRFAATL